ncbi:Tubulin/FtsZ, GTPase domain-containing protein [Tribonema minus]|uniref:Tubulin/FtsZ, GTPase domain-containing protein n=1 Tax=Tribonema minus TaxID=303371 RepID=A0A835Z1V3_9STRA|nr:Tubulin/FtsZ, GTPase domain-containing protein [Tribonema minus]
MPVLIKVVGVGGAGGNAINGMVSTTQNLQGVEFIAMNTDQQALHTSLAGRKLALGHSSTGGLGAGGRPEVGEAAAKESRQEITELLVGADMVFITAGMGGGTGTGAAPVVAEIAKGLGCLTVGVVTSPFQFEGRSRARQAAVGLAALEKHADALLVVANDRLLQIIPSRMSMTDAFLVADDILRQGVIGTSELILRPGLINVDFADVRSVVQNSGSALIGIGTGVGPTRAQDAAVGAICSPLLDYPISGASGIIFNIVGGPDMTLSEVSAAAQVVQDNVHPDANIIIGALVDDRAGKEVSVTVVATGFQHMTTGAPGRQQRQQPESAPPATAMGDARQGAEARRRAPAVADQQWQPAPPPVPQDPYINGGFSPPNGAQRGGSYGPSNGAPKGSSGSGKGKGLLGRLFGR